MFCYKIHLVDENEYLRIGRTFLQSVQNPYSTRKIFVHLVKCTYLHTKVVMLSYMYKHMMYGMYVYILYVCVFRVCIIRMFSLAFMYVCMYVRTYVCMYVCMYICMYVCMYVYLDG